MIIVNPRARAPYRAEYVDNVTISFVEIPGVGIGAQVEDDHPRLADLRAKALLCGHKVDGWNGDTLTVIATPAPVVAPTPARAPALDRPSTWADDLGAPPVLVRAALNGWTYEDATGTGIDGRFDESGGRGSNGLSAVQMSLCVPPSGWKPRHEVADPYPWEVPGWTPPPGFVPPAVRQRDLPPPAPPPDPVDDRFTDADTSAPDTSAPDAPVLERAVVDDAAKDAAAAALLAIGAAESDEQAALMVKAALDTPRAESGAPPSRGKINTYLRNRKLPTLAEDAYETIVSIL